ncbi:sugar phosphate isomerase/epimerase [Paenibacillus sp. JX-17]|uniref:Sugar phosphate isomerase/epimerase n=1 Tax=Paenibacillus lacisoli TaxID=3064525 RepID=A0ABT9CD08_9BACL|nr:sugar phosphate isomerase/epimerase [Paenibacillus sp. JX-17]MDO7907146.1 sugar phosphate isomerase/epimerase [Paenibacillus sp. JX-17]
MARWMIGQYGFFDEEKYRRDFRPDFHGIEACLLAGEEDVERLIMEKEQRGIHVGVHFPLRAGMSDMRDALFLAADLHVREEAYALVRRELEYMQRLAPDYVLFHYPKPVILDERVNWGIWSFSDEREYIREGEMSLTDFKERSEFLFNWLSRQSEQYHFIPVLEFDAVNRYVYASDWVRELLDHYPRIRICLDISRIYLQARVDPNFDAISFIRNYASYAEVVHLANVRIQESQEYRHHPALPQLSPEEGWAPVEEYLRMIFKVNPAVRVLYEHRSDRITDDELEICYTWIQEIWERVMTEDR